MLIGIPEVMDVSKGEDTVRQKITPYLWFDDNAEEVINFYVSIFKNSEIFHIQHYTEAGPRVPGTVLAISFRLDGQEFEAINGGPHFKFTEVISFAIDCGSQEEVDQLWEKLTESGEPSQCGWLKDRFGLSWQVVPAILYEMLQDPDPERATRVTQALYQMNQIDIAKLQQAYDQA